MARWVCAIGLLLAVSLPAGTVEAVSPAELKYFKLVQMPGMADDQLVYIILDQEIYKYCEPEFSDIRLFDTEKTEIASVIERDGDTFTEYPVSEMSVSTDDGKNETVIDLSMHREPVTAFQLETEATDFQCTVTVQRLVGSSYETIGSGEIYHRVAGEADERQLAVTVPESRDEKYRLIVKGSEKSIPTFRQVRCQGPAYRLVFQSRKGTSYQLFWGSSTLDLPEYDVSVLKARLAEGAPMKRARVGRGFTNPEQGDVQTSSAPASGYTGLVIVIALVMVAVMAILFRRAGRGDQ